ALAMALSTSDLLAKATLAWTSPVFGLNTSPVRPEPPLTSLPPIKWPISRITRPPARIRARVASSCPPDAFAPPGGKRSLTRQIPHGPAGGKPAQGRGRAG